MFKDRPPPLRPRRDFTSDFAYEAYVRNQRQQPPAVVREGRRWRVSWGPEDHLWYEPTADVLELCRLVAHECLASNIFFESGATPDGRPWGRQLWWRLELWLAHQQGLSLRHKPEGSDAGTQG